MLVKILRFSRSLLMLLSGCLAMHAACRADWEKIQQTHQLKVAIYKNNPPYSYQLADRWLGLDVSVARELANRLGLQLSLLPFDAGETMGDDLRNMVWRGHYLGYGPADVMMHVPIDRLFAQQQSQSNILGAYYRETVMLVHETQALPQVNDAQDLINLPLAAEQDTALSQAVEQTLNSMRNDGTLHRLFTENSVSWIAP